jgi:hypothetical protein
MSATGRLPRDFQPFLINVIEVLEQICKALTPGVLDDLSLHHCLLPTLHPSASCSMLKNQKKP